MDAMKPPRISVRHVSKTWQGARGPVEALRDISIDVGPHEFVSVVGPSGCGKSTLLGLVAGFNEPSAGEILADGTKVVGPSPARGVMFQDYALFPWRTVMDNITFGPLALGRPKGEREETARRLIALVGLDGFEQRYPHELSGGMRQRCALARMLANDPAVWLMDEPLAALDPQTRIVMQDELLRIWGDERPEDQRRAVLFVTHGIDEAVHLSDRVVVLARRPGRIHAVISIDLPRPRAPLRSSPEAAKLSADIWNLIRDEAVAAIREEPD
jgi:NitT/TauT family transport system ATP-binding protein